MEPFKTQIPLDELNELVNKEAQALLKELDATVEWPKLQKTKDVSKGDFCFVVGPIAGKRKVNPNDLAKQLADDINNRLATKKGLLLKSDATAGFVNFWINKAVVFEKSIKQVHYASEKYGTLDVKKGKKVIIEHTSANPIGPLHIGNLRNVILGGVLAQLLKSVGYEVKQHFYVNDLGYQIGMTAIGFVRVYAKVQPKLKMDQWIGMVYAMMNTFSELQLAGVNINTVNDLLKQGKKPEVELATEQNKEKLEEYVDIFVDLQKRQPELFNALLEALREVPNIKKEAAEMNLRYERNDPEAVKTFRHMVIACLSGMQETLDTYSIQHDAFDFESELGWEGSNDRVLEIMKASPYFVEPTQCNAKGVPEGGYFNLDKFIKECGFPQGKKGYQPDYPNLYVLRPDFSTLYTYRDVVYSLKKESQADMVLNIIASEQNLAQEKVSLALELLHPREPRKQMHVSYELVKLVNDKNEEFKMSSRRARYVLADQLYDELKQTIKDLMRAKFAEKGKADELEGQKYEEALHEISTAAMKYALISVSPKSLISFNMKKVTDFEDSSAPFLLYNATRFFSIFRKYDQGVKDGVYPALPPVEQVDFSLLKEPHEWELIMDYVINFPTTILHVGCPPIPDAPALPEFPLHLVCDFLITLVRAFSRYWAACKILKENPSKEESSVMFARLYLLKTIQTVLNNGLRMLSMTPLQRM